MIFKYISQNFFLVLLRNMTDNILRIYHYFSSMLFDFIKTDKMIAQITYDTSTPQRSKPAFGTIT